MNLVDGEPWLIPNTISPQPPTMPSSGVAMWLEVIYNFLWNQGEEEATLPTLFATINMTVYLFV